MKTFLSIVSVIGTLLWATAFFFGFNYYVGGALMLSIPLAVFLALILGGSVFLMIKKSQDKDSVSRRTERLAIAVYVLFSLLSVAFIGHFVDVTLNKKKAIQDEALAQIEELSLTFDAGDGSPRAGSYEEYVADNVYTYGNNLEGLEPGTIDAKKSELMSDLLDDGFVELQDYVNQELDYAKGTIEGWNWLYVSQRLDQLEKYKGDWETSVAVQSRNSDYTKSTMDFYKPTSVHNNFEIFNGLRTLDLAGCFNIYTILLVVVLQFMMIFIYFAARPNRMHGPEKPKGSEVESW
ncbi:MAG: hypothetical protein NC098_04725 [Lachnoclostridium sp.]|nr:hypothetical protein [Lachnoclostridium sp.]